MKTRMHKNSLKAYASLELEPMEHKVLETYDFYTPMSDKAVMFIGNFRLSVQPRVTCLLDRKLLKEKGSIKCPMTGRTVRVCLPTAKGRKALNG